MIPAWFATWAQTISLFDVIVSVAGILGVILFVKRGWPTVKKFATSLSRFVQMVDSVAGLPAFIERTDATLSDQSDTLAEQDLKIHEIHHELSWNQESSVKDAVRRVEMGVKGLYDEVDKLHAADTKLADDIEHTRPPSRFEPYRPTPE